VRPALKRFDSVTPATPVARERDLPIFSDFIAERVQIVFRRTFLFEHRLVAVHTWHCYLARTFVIEMQQGQLGTD